MLGKVNSAGFVCLELEKLAQQKYCFNTHVGQGLRFTDRKTMMSVIQDVLKDEYNRLSSLLDFYQKKISEYPKGSVQIKKRGHQYYSYQVYRDHHQVKSLYIGKKDSKESKDFSSKIEKRSQYQQKLKESKSKLAELSRLLRVDA